MISVHFATISIFFHTFLDIPLFFPIKNIDKFIVSIRRKTNEYTGNAGKKIPIKYSRKKKHIRYHKILTFLFRQVCMRPIQQSAGSCIKVLLGESGSDFLYAFDEDDGDAKWQTLHWNIESGGIPDGLLKQLNSMTRKGRHMTSIACGPNGDWFVSGERRDGSGAHSWWNTCNYGSQLSDSIKACTSKSSRMVASFGARNWLILNNSEISYSSDMDRDIKKIITKLYKDGHVIVSAQLYPCGGYFVKDSRGWLNWKGLSKPLEAELKHGNADVLDVICADDGSWIVIRSTRFSASKGISKNLSSALAQFYARHRQRQEARLQQIEELRKQQQERLEAERRAAEEAKRLEEERKRREEREQLMKREQDKEDYLLQLQNKRIKIGESVTVLNFSAFLGDSVLEGVTDSGIKIRKRLISGENQTIHINDPRQIIAFGDDDEDVQTVTLLCFAADKYEAAISLYRCSCKGGVCSCVKAFSASATFLPRSVNRSDGKLEFLGVGDRVHVIGYADAVIIPNEFGKRLPKTRVQVRYDDGTTYYVLRDQLELISQPSMSNQIVRYRKKDDGLVGKILPRPLLEHRGEILAFDEYRCAEKIDMVALQRVRTDVASDTRERDAVLDFLLSLSRKDETAQKGSELLQKCQVLELTIQTLYDMLKDLPPDEAGCVVHQVDYEHRDASYRGRLFAKGRTIKVSDCKYPRSATLQGMHSDLRAPLVGKFAHDIDCENSEVRLLCSLAKQMDFEQLIPTLFDYRDNRKSWLEKISLCHGVSESDAKRLATIIINGGRYETWIRLVGQEGCGSNEDSQSCRKYLKSFVFRLSGEVRALRDHLLLHPRFRWTQIDREKLKKEGMGDGAISNLLLPRIVQACENEVLGIIHQSFSQDGWIVRAKVFDGVIVEPGSAPRASLFDVMKGIEIFCLLRGWDIRLIEKPLHGHQMEPIRTLVDARKICRTFAAFIPVYR